MIWFDLTNSLFTWTGGVVGIVRAELELAKWLYQNNKQIRFCGKVGEKIVEIPVESLNWLLLSNNVCDSYLDHFGRNTKEERVGQENGYIPDGLELALNYSPSRYVRLKKGIQLILESNPFVGSSLVLRFISKILKCFALFKTICREKQHPKSSQLKSASFASGDIVFSCGWYGSGKESIFAKLKQKFHIKIVYLVYDLIMVNPELKHLYFPGNRDFACYLKWISLNCDAVIYGGRTSLNDAEKYFSTKGLRVPVGYSIKFGGDFIGDPPEDKCKGFLQELGIDGDFILAVGSIEPRKNYKLIYYALQIYAKKFGVNNLPHLIIVGKEYDDKDLYLTIRKSPVLSEKIHIIQPADYQLAYLYKQCKFTLLPSLYEGWSLALPESLDYGKLCVCSDVAPLKEIAEDLCIFIDKADPVAWADTIHKLLTNETLLKALTEKITRNWKHISWDVSGKMLNDYLENISLIRQNELPSISYDLTLLFDAFRHDLPISGILRSQLELARALEKMYPEISFFSCSDDIQGVNRCQIENICSDIPIDLAFERDKLAFLQRLSRKELWFLRNRKKLSQAFWLIYSCFPVFLRGLMKSKGESKKSFSEAEAQKYANVIDDSSYILTTSLSHPASFYECVKDLKSKSGCKFFQLVYDFSPILYPEHHVLQNIQVFDDVIKFSSEMADGLLFGGRTAAGDSVRIFGTDHSINKLRNTSISFGSDISYHPQAPSAAILPFLDLNYILAVGTIEPRKNQEILYRAYCYAFDHNALNEFPVLIICGFPGWNTSDFVRRLHNDERFTNKIYVITPSQSDLFHLYTHCKFTLQPSIYEGWSLTLTDSLNFGKFSIVSNSSPLHEVGRDLLEYVDPFDVKGWYSAIMKYSSNHSLLASREAFIKENWSKISWDDTAKSIIQYFESFSRQV